MDSGKQMSQSMISNNSLASTPSAVNTVSISHSAEFEPRIYYAQKDYYETKSKNLIGKKCLIKSSNNIEIFDHVILQQRIILRGDLAKIYIGRYVILCESVILKPPNKREKNIASYTPVQIGNHVFVDKGTIIQAMRIGSCVKIGKQCVIGPRAVIGENSILLDGSIVPADSYIAPYSVYGGKPAIYLGQLPESAGIVQKQACISYYDNFLKKTEP